MKTIRFFLFLSAMLIGISFTVNAQYDLKTKTSAEEWQFSRFFRAEKFVSDFVPGHTGRVFLTVINESRIESLTISPLRDYSNLAKESKWVIPQGSAVTISREQKSVNILVGMLHYTFSMNNNTQTGLTDVNAGTTLVGSNIALEVSYTLNGKEITSIIKMELKNADLIGVGDAKAKDVGLKTNVIIDDVVLGLRSETVSVSSKANFDIQIIGEEFQFIIYANDDPTNQKREKVIGVAPKEGVHRCQVMIMFPGSGWGYIRGRRNVNIAFVDGKAVIRPTDIFGQITFNPSTSKSGTGLFLRKTSREKPLYIYNENRGPVTFFSVEADSTGEMIIGNMYGTVLVSDSRGRSLNNYLPIKAQPGIHPIIYYEGEFKGVWEYGNFRIPPDNNPRVFAIFRRNGIDMSTGRQPPRR